MRRAMAGIGVEGRDRGIRGCVWIGRGLGLVIWKAGVGRHGDGARSEGSGGSARVVVICRGGTRSGVLVIAVIRGHSGKVGTVSIRQGDDDQQPKVRAKRGAVG